jgi:hypothetical protein
MKEKSNIISALIIVTAAVLMSVHLGDAFAKQAAGELQEKVGFLKQSVAQNQQRLRQYEWIETTEITFNGDAKPPKVNMCSYAPDGTVQKVPMGESLPQEQTGPRGRVKEKIVQKKTAEMQQYLQQVKDVIALYVPPNPQRIQDAFQGGNVSGDSAAGSGLALMVVNNYAQPGDQMTLSFDTAERKIRQLTVQTYVDDPKDPVTLAVLFASLPDGTNYTLQNILDAPAKKIRLRTLNSDYQKLGP